MAPDASGKTESGNAGNGPDRKSTGAVTGEFLLWAFFIVFFAILPVLMNALFRLITGDQLALVPLLSDGQLLLVAVGIAAAAIGDLLGPRGVRTKENTRIILMFSAISIAVLSAGSFEFVVYLTRRNEAFNPAAVAYVSLVLLGVALVVGGCCIWSIRPLRSRSSRG